MTGSFSAMTSRERVRAALMHHAVDRVPRDLGGTTATGINIVAYKNLVQYLDLDEPVSLLSDRIRLANLSETILKRFKSDTRAIIPGGSFGVGAPNPDGTFTDGYGLVRALPDESGHWYVVKSPLVGEVSRHTIDEAAKNWPGPDDPVYTRGIAELTADYHKNTEAAVILNLPLGSIHIAQWLRGFDNWLMDLVLDIDLSNYLLDVLLERWMEVTRRLIEAMGGMADAIFFAEDIAFQNGPMASPKTYKQIIQPYQKKVFRAIQSWSDAPIIYHNCGSVTWQIEDLIELGIAALNPVQVSAHDMGDTASLKWRFGDRIAFWGGIDTSRVLPLGTREDVHNEVFGRVADLNHNGGYVLASVHNIQADVPPENICAIWEAADELAEP
jgi:uroporphyrinogen decarboxylase